MNLLHLVESVARLTYAARAAMARWRRSRRRVPVLHQMTMNECGPACLAMVLRHHGIRSSVARCAESCGADRDGVRALTLLRAGEEFGLRGAAYEVPPLALAQLSMPAIVHWKHDHFVVVERCHRRRVDLVDPADGRRSVPWAEFEEAFTGVAILFPS